MITVSKKARLSLQALMFGAALLTGVSVFGMGDQNDDHKYDLNAKNFRVKFSIAHGYCLLGGKNLVSAVWDETQGERYTSDQGTCEAFVDAIQSFGSMPTRGIYEATDRAYHAHYLKNQDGQISYMKATGDEAGELQARELLRNYEKGTAKSGYQSLVKVEPLDDAKRMEYLRYKDKVRKLEEASSTAYPNNNDAQ